jgi:hypothetical protein
MICIKVGWKRPTWALTGKAIKEFRKWIRWFDAHSVHMFQDSRQSQVYADENVKSQASLGGYRGEFWLPQYHPDISLKHTYFEKKFLYLCQNIALYHATGSSYGTKVQIKYIRTWTDLSEKQWKKIYVRRMLYVSRDEEFQLSKIWNPSAILLRQSKTYG